VVILDIQRLFSVICLFGRVADMYNVLLFLSAILCTPQFGMALVGLREASLFTGWGRGGGKRLFFKYKDFLFMCI